MTPSENHHNDEAVDQTPSNDDPTHARQTLEELTNQVFEDFSLALDFQEIAINPLELDNRPGALGQLFLYHRRQANLRRELQEQGMQDVARREGEEGFDLALPARHTYLGEVDDLQTSGTFLDAGHRCLLPLLSLPGVVLMPGTTLPLRLTSRLQCRVVQSALNAPSQYSCLLIVACWNLLARGHGLVACTTELRQMKQLPDGTVNCLAVARQRCRVCKLRGGSVAEIVVLGEDPLLRIPREAAREGAAWSSWVFQRHCPYWLMSRACSAYSSFAPEVQIPEGNPLQLSFWLASNIPLHYRVRHELLALNSTPHRLRKLIEILQDKQNCLRCRKCHSEIGHARDLMAMSETGSGSVFVNASGYTHDLITIKEVREFKLEGFPDVRHSWFPGYAWTIARCVSCSLHLGWRFDAADRRLQPSRFWGLRSQAVRQGEGAGGGEEPFLGSSSDDDD